MFRLGLVDTLVTHANIKGFGLTPLSGDRRGYLAPLLKTKKTSKYQASILDLLFEEIQYLNPSNWKIKQNYNLWKINQHYNLWPIAEYNNYIFNKIKYK